MESVMNRRNDLTAMLIMSSNPSNEERSLYKPVLCHNQGDKRWAMTFPGLHTPIISWHWWTHLSASYDTLTAQLHRKPKGCHAADIYRHDFTDLPHASHFSLEPNLSFIYLLTNFLSSDETTVDKPWRSLFQPTIQVEMLSLSLLSFSK